MAQSFYERERLVEVNRLLPDIRDFLRDVIKNESLSSDSIEQCHGYIERLNAIIQPPPLPQRSGRVQTLGGDLNNESSQTNISDVNSKGDINSESKPTDHGVSAEYLEQQRELSRKATMWRNNNNEPGNQQQPYHSQRKSIKSVELRNNSLSGSLRDPKSIIYSDDRQSAIYEKILSGSASTEDDLLTGLKKVSSNSFAPPVPERKGRSPAAVPVPETRVPVTVTVTTETMTFVTTTTDVEIVNKNHNSNVKHKNNETPVVMVHDLKDPLCCGLLRNVRINIKQWGVIMSQKLYLFNDLEKPANFIGDLRFYEVMKDPVIKNVFHVTGSDSHSIILAAVNDDQYQLWYNAFLRAKLLSDAAVGKYGGSEMAEYVSIGDEDYDDNEYEQPNDLLGNAVLDKQISEIYMPINTPPLPSSRARNASSTSIVYEKMNITPSAEPDPPFESEDGWHEHFTFKATIQHPEDQDYSVLPLPPTPPIHTDVPPELPVRGHRVSSSIGSTSTGISFAGRLYAKSEDEASLSATGSLQSLDSESDNESRPIIRSNRMSLKSNSLQSSSKLKKMKEADFFNDDDALFTGVLHKRKILAVWQKHFCKVKDQHLLCYRSFENAEASYEIKLPGYQLDRADETWRKFAFKLHNEHDVLYFAAENRADLVKWLNVLAKEMHKEKFVALKDPDAVDMPRQKSLTRQESTDESEGSQPNENQSKPHHINDHTSDFDADNESGGSEGSEKKISITEQLPKNFLQVSKNRRMRSREEDSPDEPDAHIQGYLFRKQQNHWSSRWCSIKDKKFFIYRHSPRELPEAVVILEFAALTIPNDDDMSRSGGWFLFKLTYEAEQRIILSSKSKEEWCNWTKNIEIFVGSTSEEPFPYINVPASSTLQKNLNNHFFPTDEDEADDFISFTPEAISSPLNGRDFTSSVVTSEKSYLQPTPRGEDELDTSYYYSSLTEIQERGNRIEPIDHFVVLSKEKLLKFYPDKDSTIPVYVYNALTIDIINEDGVDPCILRLSVLDDNKELILKAHDQLICEEWKENLNLIHYAEIEDNFDSNRNSVDLSYNANNTNNSEKTIHEKIFRKRSKSIDKKMKNEPILISHSKTLPHMGRNKKRAKEQANNPTSKAKRLSYQKSEDVASTNTTSKKGFSQLIRSFTVDTLGRKAKNKSFEFSNDILLKETQNGMLTEVVTTKNSVTHESRYCRISGKVLYCYTNRNDVKHIWKVSLKNAAIEDDIEGENIFRIRVTALDPGDEYTLLLDSEVEFENWLAALSGEDKLHYSSGSPQIQRTDANFKSPPPRSRIDRDILDRRETNALILPINRSSTEFSPPTIPKREPLPRERSKTTFDESTTVSRQKPLSPSQSFESPPVPIRLASREARISTASDITPVIPYKKTLAPTSSSDSPRIPKRIQSRPSYKDRTDDASMATMDRIPLTPVPITPTNNDIKSHLNSTMLNDQDVPPFFEISPPVPRRMKSKDPKPTEASSNNDTTVTPVTLDMPPVSSPVPPVEPVPTEPIPPEPIPTESVQQELILIDPIPPELIPTEEEKEKLDPEVTTPLPSYEQQVSDTSEVMNTQQPKDISRETSKDSTISASDATDIDGPKQWFSAYGGSLSSLSSSNTASTLSSTITTSTLSETEYMVNRGKSKDQKLNEDDVILEEFINEVRQMEFCKSKSLRWLVLRKAVLEVYTNKTEKTPCKIINMENSTLVPNDRSCNPLTIRLKDSEGFVTEFLPQTNSIYKKWVSQIKSIEKKYRRNSTKSNSKLPLVGDIIRRRDRSAKNEDKRKSLLLVEEDYKAVQKYEESTDLSRTISGPLVEYFEDDKPDEKNRHCWIKDGFFYVAKESKSQKPIKKIDLSTVVILDESDPSKHNYAFKLNYTKDNKERCIMLKAPNQNSADKWMVSVSMGILLHRLKSPQVRTSMEIEEPCDKDHDFVPLSSSVALTISTPTYPSRSDDIELGIDIKREIAKKAEGGDEHMLNASEMLQTEFPTPNDSPVVGRREKVVSVVNEDNEDGKEEDEKKDVEEAAEKENDVEISITQGDLSDEKEQDEEGEEEAVEEEGEQVDRAEENTESVDTVVHESNKNFLDPNAAAAITMLSDEDDIVFSDEEELLENIPDRENADETFKNVRGILKQQESIRRAIVYRQKSNASLFAQKIPVRKKVPPKTKPKPSKSSIASLKNRTVLVVKSPFEKLKESFIVLKECINDTKMAELQLYNVDLESERTILLNFITDTKKTVEQVEETNLENNSSNNNTTSELNDVLLAQERLQLVSSEINKLNSEITRRISAKIGENARGDLHSNRKEQSKLYASADCLLAVNRKSPLHEKGYDSEPSLLEDDLPKRGRRRSSMETDSIII